MPIDRELTAAIRELYLAMPGAPSPDKDEDGFPMWHSVEGNAHWEFCAAVWRMARREAGYAVDAFASSRNLV